MGNLGYTRLAKPATTERGTLLNPSELARYVDLVNALRQHHNKKREAVKELKQARKSRDQAERLIDDAMTREHPLVDEDIQRLAQTCKEASDENLFDSQIQDLDEKIFELKNRLLPQQRQWKVIGGIAPSKLPETLQKEKERGWETRSLHMETGSDFTVVVRRKSP